MQGHKVSEERHWRALDYGKSLENGHGEDHQRHKKVETEMRPFPSSISSWHEEVQFKVDSQEMQETTSEKIESSGGDRGENLAAFQKYHDIVGQERRPGQGAEMEAEEGPNDVNVRQDGVDVKQVRLNTQGFVDKSIYDQVESEMPSDNDGRPREMSERVEEDAETSSLTKDMRELEVVDQKENRSRDVAHEEAGMPAEAHEEAGMPAEAHEEAGMPAEAHEEAGMPAEAHEEAKLAVVVQEKREKVEGQEQDKMEVVVLEETEMAVVLQEKREKVEVQEQADGRMEAQAETESKVAILNKAEIEPQSSGSDMESEKEQVVEPETTAKSSDQGTKIVQTDAGQQNMEQLMAEIISHVSDKDVHIQPLQGDFSEFSEVKVDSGKFAHIIEVYGFSEELSAEDLVEPFKDYRDRGFHLQRVDETHALGIFSSPEDAFAASSQMHPAMKFRPLSQSSRQSKSRAYDIAAFKQPDVPRPRTDATVARRLVTQALALPKKKPDQLVVE